MSIEERAKIFKAVILKKGEHIDKDTIEYTADVSEVAYTSGAQDQKKVDITAACLWLQTKILNPDELVQAIDSLKQAMEE